MEENKFFSLLKKKVDDLKRVKVKLNVWLIGQSKLDQLKADIPVVSFAIEEIVSSRFRRLVPISKSFDAMAKDFAIAIIYFTTLKMMTKCVNNPIELQISGLDVFLENFFFNFVKV